MLLRYSFGRTEEAAKIERAVRSVLAAGYRTADIFQPGMKKVGTAGMGKAVLEALA
jgi:3-isopropylmalate dehydrogenase